jgi:hypothetical protein
MLMKGLIADKSERFSISIKNTLHAANETRSRENYNEVDGSIFSRMG